MEQINTEDGGGITAVPSASSFIGTAPQEEKKQKVNFTTGKAAKHKGKNGGKYRRFVDEDCSSRSAFDDEEVYREAKENAYQAIIAISGLLSVGSMLCLCIVLPSMYNYVNMIGTFSKQDFSYCEVLYLFIWKLVIFKSFVVNSVIFKFSAFLNIIL